MTITPAELRARNRALRAMLAVADGDRPALAAIFTEAGADAPGGVAQLIVALAEAAVANAEQLAPDDWREQLQFVIAAEDAATPDGAS